MLSDQDFEGATNSSTKFANSHKVVNIWSESCVKVVPKFKVVSDMKVRSRSSKGRAAGMTKDLREQH